MNKTYDAIDGRPVVVLTGKPYPDVTEQLSFDRQSGLLLRRTVTTTGVRLMALPEQIDYSDYRDVGGIKVVAARLEGLDAKALRDAVDQLKSRLGDAVILLASAGAGKAALVGGVQGRALEQVKAGELVGFVAARIGGKGGGRADMAQGGGDDSPALLEALEAVPAWVAGKTGAA